MQHKEQWVVDCLTLPYAQLKQKHGKPKDERSHEQLKRYYRKKLAAMEAQPGTNPDLDKIAALLQDMGLDLQDIAHTQISFHVGYIRNADGEIEYTKPLPSIRINRQPDAEEAAFIQQAAPVRITPSTRRPARRDHKVIFAFSDQQIAYRRINDEYVPIHDERAMRVARLLCADLQPDTIVNCGDTVDLPELSRYDPDSDHFIGSLQKSFDRAHAWYAELRADNPDAEIHEVDSNHNRRLGKFVLKAAMAFYGLRQAGQAPDSWPVLSYGFLANLDAVGVEFHSGYEAAAYRYRDDLIFVHGREVRSNGSTADLLSKKYPYSNVVAGHGHKTQTHTRTTPDGQYLTAVQMGALCRIDGFVPSYGSAVDDYGKPVLKQEDWQQGVLVIRDYGAGNYQFDHVLIRDGKAYYNGKVYEAE